MNYDLYKFNMDSVKPTIQTTSKPGLKDSAEWRLVEMLSSKYPHLHKRYLMEGGFE